ncbi:MAG: HAD hydrolase-like protein [Bacteroidetes bacterium]|nr:HAD hydrolase-like protein [Bacteroidota bacterium]
MQTKMVVFDMAGTTVEDSDNVHQSFMDAMKAKGYDVTRDEVNKVMGYPKPYAIETMLDEKFRLPAGDERSKLTNEIHDIFLNDMVNFYSTDPGVKGKANVEYIFTELKNRGVKVVIDTGFSRPIADAIFKRLGWKEKGLYDYSVTSDEVERGRPHPDMILKAMNHYGMTDTKEVAKIGDTPSDLMEGMSAHCGHVIGVTWGAYRRDQLEKEKYTHLIDDLSEILTLLH